VILQRCRALLLACALLPAVVAGCRCGSTPAAAELARLTEARGAVELEAGSRWEAVAAGRALRAGDALRTGPGAEARLVFNGGRDVRLHERSLLRVGVDADSSLHVTIAVGAADIEGQGAVTVATTRGAARLEPDARVRVRVDRERARYEVLVGRAQLNPGLRGGAGEIMLAAGDGVALVIGSAEVERYRVEVGSAEVERAGAAARAAADAGAGDGRGADTGRRARGPARGAGRATGPADLTVPAGESAVIHGRRTPVTVRLRLPPGCQAGGVVVIADRRSGRVRQRVAATEEAVVRLAGGAHRYRFDCRRRRLTAGTLVVRRDAGLARLPKLAPVSSIDADGRRYTVLYQNRLPALAFQWPGAPPSDGYTLHVESAGRTHTWPATAPPLTLPSGTLAEGQYRWWFTTADGARKSPPTALAVRFDNAAIAAQVQSPRDGAPPSPDGRVDVAGVAMQGSTVAVGAEILPIDAQGRFKGRVPGPTDDRSIAVRTEHPRSGIHYYIRRLDADR
jgi:hypothetical protein